jgi:clan AA aspartic protease (TIGR02281 family)
MVLDTGATYTTILSSLAELLGYRPSASNERIRLVTASGIEQAPLVTVDAVEVLGVRVNGVKVACLNLPAESQVEGLLGLSFLKGTRLTLNFKDGILELEAP